MAPGKVMEEAQSPDRSEIQRNLASFAALKIMSPGDLEELTNRIIVRDFNEDDLLQETRGAGDYLYLVQSGALRETGKDSTGKVWWDRTHTAGAIFSRQATYDGIYEETEVIGLARGRLFTIMPKDLSWAMERQPKLREALIREPIAARLRAMPLLAPLSDTQIRRLATICTPEEVKAGNPICDPGQAGAETWFWFIDWGQVNVTYSRGGMPPEAPLTITAGNFFHNAPDKLGKIPPVTARALYRCKLIRVPLSEIEILAGTTAVGERLQSPPIIEFLEKIPSFSKLGEERRQKLASITAWEHYPASQTVSQQGVRDSSLRILHRGAAVIRTTDDQGKERPRDFMAPGRFYGESSLFRQERHETTVRAVRPDSVGSAGGILTSPDGQKDEVKSQEPGATWFRIRFEDLKYLIDSEPGLWEGTHLIQKVKEQKKKHREYDWQEEDEVLWYKGHRHKIVLIRTLLIPMLLPIALWLLRTILLNWGIDLPLLAFVLPGLVLFIPLVIWYLIDYYNDYFVVTALRVTAREQILLVYERRTEAPLEQVQDTTLRISFWGNLIGYGDLKIKTANAASQIVFDQVSDPKHIQSLIFEQRRRLLAEKLVEQREGMRMQLVKDLRLGLLSQAPDQTLPPGQKALTPLSWWQRWRRYFVTILRVIFFPLELIRRPLNFILRIFSQRRLNPRNLSKEFGGAILGSWSITPEKTVWRKHWLILIQRVWQSFLTWLVVTVAAVIAVKQTPAFWWIIPGFLWLAACAWLWWQYEDWANDLYIVTNEKVIDIERKPFGLSEQRREAGLDRIQNVEYKIPGTLATILNFGNVLIKTAAADEGFTFDLVAHPRGVQREIMNRLSAFRASRQQREASAQRMQQAYFLGVYHELMEESGKYVKDNPRPDQDHSGHRTAPRSTPGP